MNIPPIRWNSIHTIIIDKSECDNEFIEWLQNSLNMKITAENKENGLIKLQKIQN